MNLADIQGIVLRAYRALPHASYVLLQLTGDAAAARAWLAEFVDDRRIDNAVAKESGPPGSPHVRVNIALTYTGLQRLAVDAGTLATFPMEFVEGLGQPWPQVDRPDHRSRMLGDVGDSRPERWTWGVQDDARRVDVLLLAFARDPVHLEEQVDAWIKRGEAAGALVPKRAKIEIGRFPDDPTVQNREHFGFVDGISQPVLTGAARELRPSARGRQPATQEIDDGEIVIGYRDGARQIAAGPTVAVALDPDDLLRPIQDDASRHDLGINGTYLVFRKLSQHVGGFRDACAVAGQALSTSPEHAAALIVGRWQDGSPLMRAPLAPDSRFSDAPAANDFTYADDLHGERCPMGAHIRRANPRDVLTDDPQDSLAIVNRHRILRRGRRYEAGGRPHDPDATDRGLHFICVNASIARQFEFVQQNWINGASFGGLDREDDPLVGARYGGATGGYTAPPSPENRLPRRVSGLDRFVTVKAGAYFFLPGITALRFLSRPRAEARRPARVPVDLPPPSKADKVRFAMLARFAILSAAILVLTPVVGIGSPILGPNFDLDARWEMIVVAALASLAAAGVMLSTRVLCLYSRVRFGVSAPEWPLTWRLVALFQALSLPIVATALWRSATDAASDGIAWPLATFVAAALTGYAIAFAIAYAASAARGVAVRPDNPADAILLPVSERLDRLTRGVSIAQRIAGPVVHFVESRLALLSEASGVGYVNHRTGRLLPGHATIVTVITVLAVFYGIGWFALKPPAGVQLPPLAYLLFLLLIGGLAASAASFWLDRYRFPLLTVIAAWFAAVTFIGGTDHEFDATASHTSPPPIAEALASADAHFNTGAGPLIVVAAAGGGIRQAMWTARVLAGLTERFGAQFTTRLRLISGVSAGAVGALHFVGHYDGGLPSGNLQHMVDAVARPASGDIWWGLTYPDAIRGVLSFPPPRFVPRTMDRGWALERSWRRSLDEDGGGPPRADEPTLDTWRADVARGLRPAVAFNATVVETGERAVFATYRLPRAIASSPAMKSLDGRDLPLLTAARLSAAFPYVTPVARRSHAAVAEMFHFADGGYWDNSGAMSALEWLDEARPALANRPVLLILIAPPAAPQTSPVHDRAWVWQTTAPLAALVAMRTAAQDSRLAFEQRTFAEAWPGGTLTVATIADSGDGATLGWHLTRREKRAVQDAWQCVEHTTQGPLSTIASVLDDRTIGAERQQN